MLSCDTAAVDVAPQDAPTSPPLANDDGVATIDVPVAKDPDCAVGVNLPGKTSPDAFTSLATGAEAPVVLGPQGSWMVVVAARTDGFAADVKTGTIEASLTADDGTLYGKLKFKKRPLVNGGDGYTYIMNIFLVVPSDVDATKSLPWEGHDATLAVTLTPDGEGVPLAKSVTVHLAKIQ